jgi:hypothetical protein
MNDIDSIKDPAKAAQTLQKLSKFIETFGTTVTTREVAGATVYTANYRLGEGLSWTLQGTDLLVTGGLGDKLDAVIAGLQKKQNTLQPGEFAPRAKEALFRKDGVALAVDFAKIGDAVNKLPNEAFGTGPSAFMARSMASGVIAPLSRIRAVVALAPAEGGMTVDVSAATP